MGAVKGLSGGLAASNYEPGSAALEPRPQIWPFRPPAVGEANSFIAARPASPVGRPACCLSAGAPDANEVLNERAVAVMKRMSDKLTGRDFTPADGMPGSAEPDSVQQQVQRLILQATSDENLCQSYIGWCPFWCVSKANTGACLPAQPSSQPDWPLAHPNCKCMWTDSHL